MLGMPGPKRLKYDLPKIKTGEYSNRLDVYSIFWRENFNDLKFKAYFKNGRVVEGRIDEHGRTERIFSTKEEKVDLLIGQRESWERFVVETPVSFLGDINSCRINIALVDLIGNPISGLKYQISAGKVLSTSTSNAMGRVIEVIAKPGENITLLVEDLTHTMQKIFESQIPNVSEVMYRLRSPKIMLQMTLLPDGEAGKYRRFTYEVEKGDSMKGIAKQFNMSVFELAGLNQIFSDSDLHIGSVLKVRPN
jgi:hypothetical protein